MKFLALLRLLIGGTFIAAAVAKWMVGSAPLIAATIDLMNLSDSSWSQAERAWQAIGLFEVVLGLTMVFSAQRKHWNLALGGAVAAFLVWDVARWLTGGPPDCGCFGGFSIATSLDDSSNYAASTPKRPHGCVRRRPAASARSRHGCSPGLRARLRSVRSSSLPWRRLDALAVQFDE